MLVCTTALVGDYLTGLLIGKAMHSECHSGMYCHSKCSTCNQTSDHWHAHSGNCVHSHLKKCMH